MRFAGINKNDVSAAPGICVTFFAQGCRRHCPGCHNPGSWDFQGGQEFTDETIQTVINAISEDGVPRNFCVMGGEPLDELNCEMTLLLIQSVRAHYPDIKIYLWTGYYYEELLGKNNNLITQILNLIDCLIDGPYEQEKRDITLSMRGSSN